MIYLDMKCFQMKKNIDITLDETISVNELLSEISSTFPLYESDAQVISTRNKKLLSKTKSLKEQGVLGGDTLILIGR